MKDQIPKSEMIQTIDGIHFESRDSLKLGYKVVSVDFDNTLATGAYPDIKNAKLVHYAKETLNEIVNNGHMVIINTLRTQHVSENMALEAALKFLNDNDIPFHYANQNDPKTIEGFGESRKIAADIIIDDLTTIPAKVVNWSKKAWEMCSWDEGLVSRAFVKGVTEDIINEYREKLKGDETV